jgi:hypothetical protein
MSKKDSLVFSIENKKTAKSIYRFDVSLLDYQIELINNNDLALFYVFKDASQEAEELVSKKLNLGKTREDLVIKILNGDKLLYDADFDVFGLEDGNHEKNEVELYFIFDKISKKVLGALSKAHQEILLTNPDKFKND